MEQDQVVSPVEDSGDPGAAAKSAFKAFLERAERATETGEVTAYGCSIAVTSNQGDDGRRVTAILLPPWVIQDASSFDPERRKGEAVVIALTEETTLHLALALKDVCKSMMHAHLQRVIGGMLKSGKTSGDDRSASNQPSPSFDGDAQGATGESRG